MMRWFPLLLAALGLAGRGDGKIQVLTTTPELRAIAAAVGGDLVEAKSLLVGPEDPHFVNARPSTIKAANRADLFVKNGMSLEIGYEPLIVADSRNPKIQPGSPGYVDASLGIRKLEVPPGLVDRSLGDVHPEGNPHYLLDPMNGKVVARTLRDALARLDPAHQADYGRRCDELCRSIDEALFGPKLLDRFKAETLGELMVQGKLASFLRERGAEADLGGWAAAMAPVAGQPIVCFHANLSYFCLRFGLRTVASLEPKPGVQPSSAHLEKVIALMREQKVRAVFHTVFQPRKPVEKVCAETGAADALFPHQVGSTEAASDYLKLVEEVVKVAARSLAKAN